MQDIGFNVQLWWTSSQFLLSYNNSALDNASRIKDSHWTVTVVSNQDNEVYTTYYYSRICSNTYTVDGKSCLQRTEYKLQRAGKREEQSP